jgi:hypothetical protein
MKLCCKDCVAWDCKSKEGDSKDDEEFYGKCRIKPPLRLGNLLKAAWPITHRHDWCLECIPKQLVQEASVFLFMLIGQPLILGCILT